MNALQALMLQFSIINSFIFVFTDKIAPNRVPALRSACISNFLRRGKVFIREGV